MQVLPLSVLLPMQLVQQERQAWMVSACVTETMECVYKTLIVLSEHKSQPSKLLALLLVAHNNSVQLDQVQVLLQPGRYFLLLLEMKLEVELTLWLLPLVFAYQLRC